MKKRLVYIFRKPSEFVSIERVFECIARQLEGSEFDISFCYAPYRGGLGSILLNLLFFRPPPGDLYHITGDIHYLTLRLPGDRTILTIHDLIFLHRRKGVRRRILKWLYLESPISRGVTLTAVSNSTKHEVETATALTTEMVKLIENPLTTPITAGEGAATARRSVPVLLQIGTAPNKNLHRLVSAVSGLRCHLRIIGRLQPSDIAQLEAREVDYSNAMELSEDAMVQEYENADVLTFLSTYEGFGLPIIEAQAAGLPVITSREPPLSDVAGKGAVLVDPRDEEQILNAIQVLLDNAELRQRIVEQGLVNIRRFSPEGIARQYMQLYESVAGSG